MRIVDEIASTNVELARAAVAGEVSPWTVLVTEHQSAGRGRLGRTWTSIRGATLTFSALVPTPSAPAWVPLITGLALSRTIDEVYASRTFLKWPNDLLAQASDESARKLAGILCELTPAGVVVGVGLNVDQSEDELPVETATSLRLVVEESGAGVMAGGHVRERLLLGFLRHLAQLLQEWGEDRDQVRDAYRSICSTIGAAIVVDLGGEGRVSAQALDVDADGQLVVEIEGERRILAAGDVTHVRVRT